jgi:hypothetical protein
MASSKKRATATPVKADRPPAKKATTKQPKARQPKARQPKARQPKARQPKADKPLSQKQAAAAQAAKLYLMLRDTLVGISSNSSEYPPTLERLFELAGQPLDAAALSAVADAKRGSHVGLSLKIAKGKPASHYSDAVAFLPADIDRVASSPLLLYRVLRRNITSDGAKRSRANVFNIAALTKMVHTSLAKLFGAALQAYAGRNEMPAGIGMVLGDEPLFFLIEHAVLGARFPDRAAAAASPELADRQPAAPAVPVAMTEFEREFQAAFERLDIQSGNQNYVLLHDLRRALPGIPRVEFDARLNELRRNKAFSLDSADGRHVRLTPEQLDAGIREASSLLVYVARR